jgi:hypothetical protein
LTSSGDDRIVDFYTYNSVVKENFIFTIMPGDIDDDISDRSHIDYDKIKVSIVDLKNLDEIMRW